MLEKIREGSQGLAARIILGFVILTFALAGVGSYLTGGGAQSAAVVNGDEIGVQAFSRAYQNERARMQQQLGEMFNQLAANEGYLDNFKKSVLDRLIADKLMDQSAQDLGLRVSDGQIKEAIRNMPEFQVDGKFDNNRYLALLNQAGFQPSNFRDYLRVEMTRRQLMQASLGSDFALNNEVEVLAALQGQKRSYEYVVVPASNFADSITLTEGDVKASFEANRDAYQSEEMVTVEYVSVGAKDLEGENEVSEEEAKLYYDDNKNSYLSEASRHAAHILIEFGDDEAAAKAKAQAVLARIKQGESFEELAKTESMDTFTAENGGDLDWFEAGVMDPEFEAAAFALSAPGDVSDVVKSSFGFHIIKLIEAKEESVQSFDEVKDKILANLKEDNAKNAFYELQTLVEEAAFQNEKSLAEAAAVANVQVVKTEGFNRSNVPAALKAPSVMSLIFDQDFIANGVNSSVLEVGEDQIMFVRVDSYEPARSLTLDEVKDQVEAKLKAEKQKDAAEQFAKTLKDKWNAGDIAADAADAKLEIKKVELGGRFDGGASYDVRQKAFSMPQPADAPVLAAVSQANGDAAIIKLTAVEAGKLESEGAAEKQRLQSQASQLLYKSFIQAQKDAGDIIETPQVLNAG